MAKRTKKLTSQGDESEEIRINKFLSESGVCSRREADRYITEGKVKIDGKVAEMGSKVTKDSVVTFLDKPVKREEKLVLIAFNKPEGIVCTTDQREPDNIVDFIKYGMRIYPIGRLDKDSEGLILLTNDGNIVNKILRAEHHHEKEYIVRVNKEITAEFIQGMSSGVPILDTVTNPCKVTQIDKFTFNIVLTQGLNRQIRRMCEYFEYRVVALTRIRIMNIQLGRLKTGDYRNVTEKEIEELNQAFQQQEQKIDKNKQGQISHDKARSEKERQEKTKRNKIKQDKVSYQKTQYNKAKQDKAGSEKTQYNKAKDDKVNSEKTQYNKAKQDKVSSEKTQYNKAKPDKVNSEKIQYNKTKQDKAGSEKNQYNKAKQDKAGSDKIQYDKTKHNKPKHEKNQYDKSKHEEAEHDKINYNKNNHDRGKHVKSEYEQGKYAKSMQGKNRVEKREGTKSQSTKEDKGRASKGYSEKGKRTSNSKRTKFR